MKELYLELQEQQVNEFFKEPIPENIEEIVDIEMELISMHSDTTRELEECRNIIHDFKIGKYFPKSYNQLIQIII